MLGFNITSQESLEVPLDTSPDWRKECLCTRPCPNCTDERERNKPALKFDDDGDERRSTALGPSRRTARPCDSHSAKDDEVDKRDDLGTPPLANFGWQPDFWNDPINYDTFGPKRVGRKDLEDHARVVGRIVPGGVWHRLC